MHEVVEKLVEERRRGYGKRERCDFKKALQKRGEVGVICEYKSASPSTGKISETGGIEEAVGTYEKAGACAVSVLTEESRFGGSLEDLRKARDSVGIPVLRKDFIVSKLQLYEALVYGADAVLLIAGICPDLGEFLQECERLGLDALVECHTKDDIEHAAGCGAEIIGVNNRSLDDLSVDLERCVKLGKYVPNDCIFVAESGVKSSEDVRTMKEKVGADAVLVGTHVMKAGNVFEAVKELVEAGRG
jgi:indole-3-glycerol phosphate synthase